MRTNFVDRAFGVAGPRVWNYLPTDLTHPNLYNATVQTAAADVFIWSVKAQCKFIPTQLHFKYPVTYSTYLLRYLLKQSTQ